MPTRKVRADILRTKGDAETIVAGSDLAWTVFRPSVIFGRGGSVSQPVRRASSAMMPISCRSPLAKRRFQPVFVGDVAARVRRWPIDDDRDARQRYGLCGPKVYTCASWSKYVGPVDWIQSNT